MSTFSLADFDRYVEEHAIAEEHYAAGGDGVASKGENPLSAGSVATRKATTTMMPIRRAARDMVQPVPAAFASYSPISCSIALSTAGRFVRASHSLRRR